MLDNIFFQGFANEQSFMDDISDLGRRSETSPVYREDVDDLLDRYGFSYEDISDGEAEAIDRIDLAD